MSSDYKTFYEQQERIRSEMASFKEKAREEARVIAAETAKVKDLEDVKKTIENWRRCVTLAAKDGEGPKRILCDNDNLRPSESALRDHPEASEMGLRVTRGLGKDGEFRSWIHMRSARAPLSVYPPSSRSHYVPSGPD